MMVLVGVLVVRVGVFRVSDRVSNGFMIFG